MALDLGSDVIRIRRGDEEACIARALELDHDSALSAVHDREVPAERATPSPHCDHTGNAGPGRADASKFRPRVLHHANGANGADGNPNVRMHRLELLELGHLDHEVRALHDKGCHVRILRGTVPASTPTFLGWRQRDHLRTLRPADNRQGGSTVLARTSTWGGTTEAIEKWAAS